MLSRLGNLEIVKKISTAHKIVILVASISVLILGLMAYITYYQFNHLLRQSELTYGETLAHQTAQMAADLLFTEDFLGLKVLTNRLTTDPNIISAAVYSLDNRILAQSTQLEAGQGMLMDASQQITVPVTFQNFTAGYMQIKMNIAPLQATLNHTLQWILMSGLVVILAAVLIMLAIIYYPRRYVLFSAALDTEGGRTRMSNA